MKRSALPMLIALVALGCGATTTKQTPQTSSSPLNLLQTERDIDGAVVGESDPKTQATVVIVFASWCGPCRHELAILGQISKQRPAVRIIGINAYEEWGNRSDEARLRRFLGQNAPWLQVVHAQRALLRAFGGVPKIPSLFLFDRDGRLVRAFKKDRRAPPGRQELQRAIDRAVGAAVSSRTVTRRQPD